MLCMVCPAFADLDANGNVSGTSTPADCTEPTLEGTSGTSTFTANWTAVWHTITLNEDDYDASNNANGNGDSANGSNASPKPLYSAQGDSNVYQGTTGNGDTFYLTGPIAETETVLSALPQGKYVNYTLNPNAPGSINANNITMPTSTQARLVFDGFYKTVSGTPTQMITSAGVLTAAGSAQSSAASADQTWTAQYTCGTPTITGGNPSVNGYTFQGWSTSTADPGAGNYVTPGCINADTPLYAIWSPVQYTITYTCGTKPNGASTNFATGHTTTGYNGNNLTVNINMDAGYTLRGDPGNCQLPGYKLKGWSCPNLPEPTSQNGIVESGVYKAAAQGTYSYAGNITCNAVWKPITIDLVWELGAGADATTDGGNTCTFDSSIQLPQNVTRPGYQFAGWTVTNNPTEQSK